jgi:hypothetical protein
VLFEAEHADARLREDLEVPELEPGRRLLQHALHQPSMDAAHDGGALAGDVGERAPPHRHLEPVHLRFEAVRVQDADEHVRSSGARSGSPPGDPAPGASGCLGVRRRLGPSRDGRDERPRERAMLVHLVVLLAWRPLPDAPRAAGRRATLGVRADDARVLEDPEVPAHRVRVEPDPPRELARVERLDGLLERRGELGAMRVGECAVDGGGIGHALLPERHEGRGTGLRPSLVGMLSGSSCLSGCRP